MNIRTTFFGWQKLYFIGRTWHCGALAAIIVCLFSFPTARGRAEHSSEPLMQPVITGMVTGPVSKPVAHVRVKLLSTNETLDCETTTDSSGEFILPHKACQTCCLEVAPPKNSGLSPAWIDNIPGEATRKIVVSLRPGFEIKGRVLHNGKGLKDVIIAISPLDEEHGFIHGGGWTRTNSSGTFDVTLAPGLKRLVVSNRHYPDLQARFESRIVVTEDGKIPDINLPPRQVKEQATP